MTLLRIFITLLALLTAVPASARTGESYFQLLRMGYAPQVRLHLNSRAGLVYEQGTGRVLYAKNAEMDTPIASLTKLMTAMVFLDHHPKMNKRIEVTEADVDMLKHSSSHLPVGTVLTRKQMLNMALVASENRAASALARTTLQGGTAAFVAAMNRKARAIGLRHTHYVEPTGLNPGNVSTAADLARLVNYAYEHYPEIRKITSQGYYAMGLRRVVERRRDLPPRVIYEPVDYDNTNRFTREPDWHIGLSKTGFINESGHCLAMQARIDHRNLVIVLLDAPSTWARIVDTERLRDWLESQLGKRT